MNDFKIIHERQQVENIVNNSSPDKMGEELRKILGHPKTMTNKMMVYDNGTTIIWENGKAGVK